MAQPAAGARRRAVVLIGHGSRVAAGNAALLQCAGALQAALWPVPVSHCFIELAAPGMDAGLQAAAAGVELEVTAAGARRVDVLPLLLLTAGHARRDIPAAIARARRHFPQVNFRCARALGTGPAMQAALLGRLNAVAPAGAAERAVSLLLVVGRGGSDAAANAAVATLARRLQRAAGFGRSAVAYCDVAAPDVPTALAQALAAPGMSGALTPAVRGTHDARTPAAQVVVLPFLLFPGVLLHRLTAQVAAAAAASPHVPVRLAEPIGAGPELTALLLQRLDEIGQGEGATRSAVAVAGRA